MSRRKFNLGDILRKLNEESDTPGSSPAERDKTAASSLHGLPSGTGLPEQPVVASDGNREGDLPDQPNIGHRPVRHFPIRDSAIEKVPAGRGAGESYTITAASETISPSPRSSTAPPLSVSLPASSSQTAAPVTGGTSTGPVMAYDDEDDDEESFDVYKYIGILLRRKYIILLVAVIATLLSLFRYLKSDSYYIATARLLFRPDAQEILTDQRMFRYWGDREKMFSTHLELLRSQTVLTMVAENIGGTMTPERIGGSLTIKQGETDGEKNDIIELSYRDTDPETARDVLNELCRSYIDYRRDVNAQEITRLVSKFEFQITKVQDDLSEKENALRHFKETNRMVELSNETNVTISKLADMETALQQTQLELLESKERFSALNTQISRQQLDVVQSVTFHDPFQNRIAELELELNTLTNEYSSEHFKVKMLRQQIDNLKAATADSMTREAASKTLVKNPIRQTLLQDLVNLTIEKSALEAKRMAQEQLIERLNKDLIKLPSMEQQYAFLQRETESLLQTLRMLKGKYEEAKIRRDSEESDLKLLEMARTPKTAISEVKKNSVLIAVLVGFIIGIALALLLEYLDQSLKDPSAVEKTLGVPLLGIVPYIEADNALIEQFADLTKNILEPFRALRANLKHIATANNLQVFIVCSAIKGEGKTTLAANLGITFSVDGKRVILVDADLRRSQAHTLFAIPKQTGLADYLMGSATIDEIIKPTRFENMSVVTSGERPHNPAELLGTVLFDRLIAELRTRADIIIFDSPALLPVSDTITMAPKMDGVLFVVRTFWTPVKAAKQALNQLQRIGSHLYGGILNGASHSGKYYPYYYGYYGYYGYYSYKYAYEDDRDHKSPFSLRHAGLRIEKATKEHLTSLWYAAPKTALLLNRGMFQLAQRKFFWFLVIVLLGVTGARIALNANGTRVVTDPIRYIGLGANDRSAVFDREAGAGVQEDIAFSGSSEITGAIDTLTISPSDNRDAGGRDSVLNRTVHEWFSAFSRENTDRYLSFYDRETFRFDGGDYERWEEKTRQLFLLDEHKSTALLDGFRTVSKDSVSVEVYVDFRLATPIDTVAGRMAALWVKKTDGWRIVRQKSLEHSVGREKGER